MGLRPIVSLPVVCTECIVAKRCVRSKSYYWQPIESRINEKSIGTKWPWPLFKGCIKVVSTIALYSTFIIIIVFIENCQNAVSDNKRNNKRIHWELIHAPLLNSLSRSRKPLEIEAWFQRTTNRKWHMGYQMVTWPMTSRNPEMSNSWLQYA